MLRILVNICLLPLFCLTAHAQEIRLEHKQKPAKVKTVRLDKPVMVRTFEGLKLKGEPTVLDNGNLLIEGKKIATADIMTLAGFVDRNSREKAYGLGLTIGAGIVFPTALYFILGGIAWGFPNGIFVGSTLMVFDLLLAYLGTNLMGIYPKRFSTYNWQIMPIPAGSAEQLPLPQILNLPLSPE